MEYTLREYTKEEQEADMRKELAKTSLYNCVKFRCDLIDDECKNQQMKYLPHRTIQEFMCEILDLIRMEEVAYNKAIDKCKQILMDAMARDGKTKCHEYMVALNEMEKLKL